MLKRLIFLPEFQNTLTNGFGQQLSVIFVSQILRVRPIGDKAGFDQNIGHGSAVQDEKTRLPHTVAFGFA